MASRTAHLLVASLTALAVTGTLGTALPAGATDADRAVTVTIKPAELDRGAGPSVPRVLGATILDRDRQITLDNVTEATLLGTSAGDYVVGTYRGSDGLHRIERVAADGSRETIRRNPRGSFVLSTDGTQLFESTSRPDDTTVVTVRDALTGERQSRRTFTGYAWVLDADEGSAVLASSGPSRTFWWDTETDRTSSIARREGYFADIRADRVATIRVSGPESDCSRLTALAATDTTLWRSCEHAVVASSPDGRRLLARSILQDGPNSMFSVHRADGRRLVGYRAAGSFGDATWENDGSVLLTTYGSNRGAVVRCELADCERASKRMRTRF